jgi:hypothetical protein
LEKRMFTPIKKLIKSTPVIGPLLVQAKAQKVKSSADYWDQRYQSGGNSGPGSYNRLAEFKADVLNRFVADHNIASVIEFGCGDGSQLKLAHYPAYLGIDVSTKAVELCRTTFANDPSKRFLLSAALEPGTTADLALSLDVIYHLTENTVYEAYMHRLFQSALRFVIIYSSNMDQPSEAKHVRHRRFIPWVERNQPHWVLHSTIKNAYPWDLAEPDQTSFADFYVFSPRQTAV